MTGTPDGTHDPDQARTDAAIHELQARSHWPQPTDPASGAPLPGLRPERAPAASSNPVMKTSTGSGLRKLGVGVIGLLGGLLLGLLARLFVPPQPSLPLALSIGAITAALAIAGVAVALLIDHRYHSRRGQTRHVTIPDTPSAQSGTGPERKGTPMTRVGIGALGSVGGLLLALILQDILAVAFLGHGTIPFPLAVVVGFLLPTLAVLGAVVAILLDNRNTTRTSKGRTNE
ncbi:MAG: hypothetical protein Q4G34_02975 [Micrococcus sp.]|nr:hypothetical protein [Micrococcus sp.]